MQVHTCRHCRHRGLVTLLDLGEQPLANRFLTADQLAVPEPRYPLRLAMCPQCSLVQLDEEVPRQELFDEYVYVTGTSATSRQHIAWLVRELVRHYRLGRADLVVEAGSNDGTLLAEMQRCGVSVLGVEPARNLAEESLQRGIPTLVRYFDETTARLVRAEHGPCRVFVARHVLAHVADLHGFIEGIRAVLQEDGIAVIEVPHLLSLYQRLEFDTIYHEHLCYFSLAVLRDVLGCHGLRLVRVTPVSIHGGSLVVEAGLADGPYSESAGVAGILQEEARHRLADPAAWQLFAQRVEQIRDELTLLLDQHQLWGKRCAGYGAPAKGNTLLNYCRIGRDRLPYLVDKNPLKQGKWTPGMHVPVYAPDRLFRDPPDLVLILAWNCANEIVRELEGLRRRGTRCVVPLPRPVFWPQASVAATS